MMLHRGLRSAAGDVHENGPTVAVSVSNTAVLVVSEANRNSLYTYVPIHVLPEIYCSVSEWYPSRIGNKVLIIIAFPKLARHASYLRFLQHTLISPRMAEKMAEKKFARFC